MIVVTATQQQKPSPILGTATRISVEQLIQDDNTRKASSYASVNPGPTMPSQDHSVAAEISQDSDAGKQQTIQRLTMPPVPNYDIPPSPPGSPAGSVNKRFVHFLKLKSQGVHFNAKLENSSALRNPALTQKLLDFAKIDEWDQYASALPPDLGVPTAYPPWAYSHELNKTQQAMRKKKDEHNSKHIRDKLEFVPGSISRPTARTSTNQSSKKRVN